MPVKYVPYIPEPVSGQAVLGNFNRVLKYKGADDLSMTLQRGMPLYEMEKTETAGDNKDGNLVIRGECISACAYLKEQGIEVDLVYIDPPFASGADYAKRVYIRKNPKITEAITAAEQELEIDELKSFEEKMYGDVWDKEKYLNWMYENLMAIKSIMSETASIYVHLDWHIGHYVKILMDEIFGENNFRNEIAWGYRIQGVGKEFWARKHDNIYFYTKSEYYTFNPENEDVIYEKPFIDTQESFYAYILKENDKNQINELINNGKPLPDKYKTILFKKYYSNVYVRDIWDCDKTKPIISGSSEYLGYKTQKPEGLLERIIKASSDDKMLVADFFGGSGVTAAVANKLSRRFIHCDVGINSIQTTRDRLVSNGASFDVLEIKDGVELYRNPAQTMDKLKSLIPGLKEDDTLDSFWAGSISDSKLGTVPVYLPDLKDSNTKILDIVLINRTINEAMPELDADIKKVIIYYIDQMEKDVSDFIRENGNPLVKIELRDLKSVLDDVVVTDSAQFSVSENQDGTQSKYTIEIKNFHSDRVLQKILEFNNKARLSAAGKKPFKPIEISEYGLETIELVSIDCTNDNGKWHSDSEIKIDKLGHTIINGEKTKKCWDAAIHCDKKPKRMKIRNICGDESVWEV